MQHSDLAGLMARYQKQTVEVREWEGVGGPEVVWDGMGSFLRRDAESLLEKRERLGVCSKLFYMQVGMGGHGGSGYADRRRRRRRGSTIVR